MFKYIMFQDKLGAKQPILFPKSVSHITMAEALANNEELNWVPVSAGFCGMTSPICCYGKSVTMDLESNPNDTVILSTHPWCFGLFNEMSEVIMEFFKEDAANAKRP